MERSMAGGAWTTLAKVAVAVLAGTGVIVLLFPFISVDTLPMQWLSVFGYGVPCDAGWATAEASETVLIVGVLLGVTGRRR